MPPYSDRTYASPYSSDSVGLQTPPLALTPSSYASSSKRPATPPHSLNFDGVPNLPYFRGQWVYVGNLERLDPKLSWEAFDGNAIRWLAGNDPDALYDDEEPGPLGIILLGQLAQFTRLECRKQFQPVQPWVLLTVTSRRAISRNSKALYSSTRWWSYCYKFLTH